MSFCKGKRCLHEPGSDVPHSLECQFEHFESFAGFDQLPDYIRDEIFEWFQYYHEHKRGE